MGDKSLRVYFTTHHDGRLTGQLLPVWEKLFAQPPPSAYGASEAEVLAALETRVRRLLHEDDTALERFLWEETLEARTITVEIHPQTLHQKRPIISQALIPLRLTYVYGRPRGGPWRVRVPRFGWSFVLEDLSIARDVLQNALGTALLGEKPQELYDFRHEGEEYVRTWEPPRPRRESASPARRASGPAVLEQVAEELTSRALGRQQPALVDDAASLREVLALAERQPPPSLLLVGGPGTGKTASVSMLARRIAERRRDEDAPARLPDIWRTSAERLLAGMVYLGMWQERCLKLIDALSHESNWLYVDRLTSLLVPQSDGASIADLLLPAARSGEVSLIAECTEAEYEHCQRRFPEALRPFVVRRLTPPPASAMPELMVRYQAVRHGRVALHPAGARQLVGHLETFQRDSLFPGKAFRFLDWLEQEGRGGARTLYPREASEAYARYSGLPLRIISDEVPADRHTLATWLQKGVIGQDRACELAAGVLARFKAGMNDPDKPVGTLLFAGPTGVGKTELARQLTRALFGDEQRLVRLDMSEYMLPGSAQRLMEVGPGITSLAERVRQQPLCLVLLDELEKAHAEVFDLLLGLLGEGRLTDALGRQVDFRMAVVCMTTNLGVTLSEPAGFGAERGAEDFTRAVRQAFRPEFFNRLDHVLPFRRLSEADVLRIVDLELTKAAGRAGLARRQLTLDVDPEARAWLAHEGHDPHLGARPLKRLIEAKVMAPLAVRLAADTRLHGARLPVVVAGSAAERALSPEQRALATLLGESSVQS